MLLSFWCVTPLCYPVVELEGHEPPVCLPRCVSAWYPAPPLSPHVKWEMGNDTNDKVLIVCMCLKFIYV